MAETCRNLRVGEAVWRRVRHRAVDEGITVRELTERALHQYLGPAATTVLGGVKESALRVLAAPKPATADLDAKHWTEPEEVP